MLKNQFIRHTDACVEDFLKGDVKSLFGNLKQLSHVVLDNFKPMIPQQFHNLWKQGIESNDYYLKLCGSVVEDIFLASHKISTRHSRL